MRPRYVPREGRRDCGGIAVINNLQLPASAAGDEQKRAEDGLLFQYLARDTQDPILPSALMHSVESHSCIIWLSIRHASNLALSLFDQLQPVHALDTYERRLLIVSSLLHDAGVAVNQENHYKHTFYMILNAESMG